MSVPCILSGQIKSAGEVVSFNGRKGVVVPQTGDYTAAQVGALASDGTAAAATKLATARTIQTNLASTFTASFNGSSNITPGVTGILPVANGGTGVTSLSELSDILLPYLGTPWVEWGDQTASGAGNSTWWSNLRSWILNNSTSLDRKACVGMTKSVTLSSAILGTTTHLVVCIGADQDADKTLTFQTLNCLAQSTAFGSSNGKWINSLARTQCQNYYNAFPGKNYIKTVSKGTCEVVNNDRNGTPIYNNETVWLPSEREMGLNQYSSLSTANSTTSKSECTEGTNFSYSYYTSNNNRKKKRGDSGSASNYWDRSILYNSSLSLCNVDSSGLAYYRGYGNSSGLAPAFVIG